MGPHKHSYKFESNKENGHLHKILGYTDNMIGLGSFHFHYYNSISSYCGHTHYFSGITGLPIRTENGHIHRIEGQLEINEFHEHMFSGYTFEDIAYSSRRFMRRAGAN